MAGEAEEMTAIAERHGLSADAVRVLVEAMRGGHGGGAQWSHPDLGGMGQWSGGDMLQIGDMFNDPLKARVRAALEELATGEHLKASAGVGKVRIARIPEGWWPAEFGAPSSTGAQNAMRYACFPDIKRLVVEQDRRTTVYDTGGYCLTGFSQAQGQGQTLTFNGPDGPVSVACLTVIG